MAADFAMQYESVKRLAKQIGDLHRDFAGMIHTMDNLVDSLDGQWVGTAHDEFVAAYKKLCPKLKSISSVMGNYESAIRKGSDKQFEVDNDLSKRYKSIGTEDHGSSAGIVIEEPKQELSNKYLSSKQFNGTSYRCLEVKDDYPDQAPNQCWANCVSITESIMNAEGVHGSRQDAAFDCSVMAEDITNGKPVLLHFLHGGGGGEHWIVAVGIKESSSQPYSINDFLFVDSYNGQLCEWNKFATSTYYKNSRPCGMQRYA